MRRRGRDGHPHAHRRTSLVAGRGGRRRSTRPRSARSSSSIPASSATRPSASARRSRIATATSSCSTTWASSRAGVRRHRLGEPRRHRRRRAPAGSELRVHEHFANIAYKMDVCRERGLGPSIAIFEPGFLRVVLAYHAAGALPAGTLVKFYFSEGGYLGGGDPLWGAPPIIEALDLVSRDARRRADPVGGRGARRFAARHADRARRARARRPPPRRPRGLGRRARRTSSRSPPRPSCAGDGPRRRDDRRGGDGPRVPPWTANDNKAVVRRFLDALRAATSRPPPRASTPSATTRTRGRATSPSPGRR